MFRFIVALLCINAVFGAVPLLPRQTPSGRIVGGFDAKSGDFPYQISIRDAFNRHFCGASIINVNSVLTAAHCVSGQPASNVFVIAGSHLLNSGGYRYDTTNIIVHPSFNSQTLANDVAVIRTKQSFSYTDLIQPTPLINRDVQSGSVVVSGWGLISAGNTPNNLQYLYTNVISWADCSRRIGINADTVCAFLSKSKGICAGDSGGPLVVPNEGQVGINSFAYNGCGGGYPDGYCSVYYHRSWIMNNSN